MTSGGSASGAVKFKNLPKGPPPVVTRSVGSRELMELRWRYPVHQPEAAPAAEHGTSVAQQRAALSREKALEVLSAGDPRPLLVLRECAVCNKTDDALLARTGSNERTLILARWFHCVKLPVDVVQADHPFNALFPTNEAEHLFVSAPDGSGKLPLESDTSRTELWTAMERTLAQAYGVDAGKSVKQVLAGLDRIDQLERKADEAEARKGQLMEKTPVDRKKVEQVDEELVRTRKQVAEARKELEALFQIEPRKPVAPAR